MHFGWALRLSVRLFLTVDQTGWHLPTPYVSGINYLNDDFCSISFFHSASIVKFTELFKRCFHASFGANFQKVKKLKEDNKGLNVP